MTNPSRVQAGVPSGGQFTERTNSEAELELSPPSLPAAGFSAYRVRELDAELEPLLARRERTIARAIAETVRSIHPDASRLVLHRAEEGDDAFYEIHSVLDADGQEILSQLTQPFAQEPGAKQARALVNRIDMSRKDHVEADYDPETGESSSTLSIDACADLDLDQPKLYRDPMQALWFNAGAIRDHFEVDDDDADYLGGLDDQDLMEAGQWALQDDDIYGAFHRSLERGVESVRAEKARAERGKTQ